MSDKKSVKVLVVDDSGTIRKTAEAILTKEGYTVATAEDGFSALSKVMSFKPDLIFLDIILPDMTGIAIARKLRETHPGIRILILSSENTTDTVKDLLQIGIDGFISKRRCNSVELSKAVRVIMEGECYFGRDISTLMYNIIMAKRRTQRGSGPNFTDREAEVIRHSHEGLSAKQIAEVMGISHRTVEAHKTHIFKKLGINNTYEMIQYAIKCGIISPDG